MRRAFSAVEKRPRRAGHGRSAARLCRRWISAATRWTTRRSAPTRRRPMRATSMRRRDAARRRLSVILAGQGVLYAEATDELLQSGGIAASAGDDDRRRQERLSRRPRAGARAPAATPSPGTAAFPVHQARSDLRRSAPGSTCIRSTTPPLPNGKQIIHATNDTRDLHKTLRHRSRAARRRQADPGRVDRGGEGPARRQTAQSLAAPRRSRPSARHGSRAGRRS